MVAQLLAEINIVKASQAASVVDVARGGHVGTATSESISVGQASPF